MADEYQGPLSVELLEKYNSEIARIIAELPDDVELIATPLMDELVYRRKDFDRVCGICRYAIESGVASPLRVVQLKIVMVNAERRKPNPWIGFINEWMGAAWDVLAPMPLDTPGVRRTVVLFRYNAALLCRLSGDFAGEAEHHRAISKIAEDAFSRNNAEYMAEFAMMLAHGKEGTATYGLWHGFQDTGDAYRATLDERVPREAQWIANDWAHRTELTILLGYAGEEEGWFEEGFNAVARLLSIGVPRSARYAADLIIAMALFEHIDNGMACWEAERIIADEAAGNEWRMLAALLKALITEKENDFRAVVAMPGDGICHAARAVAKRMLASKPS